MRASEAAATFCHESGGRGGPAGAGVEVPLVGADCIESLHACSGPALRRPAINGFLVLDRHWDAQNDWQQTFGTSIAVQLGNR